MLHNTLRFLFILSILISSCSPPTVDPDQAAHFFPPASLMKEGITNKYYYHFKSHDGYDEYTDIEYQQYILEENGDWTINRYSPALILKRNARFQWEGQQMKVIHERRYSRRDTFESEIKQPVYIDWSGAPSTYEVKLTYPNDRNIQLILETQLDKDTLIGMQAAKVFKTIQTLNDDKNEQTPSALTTLKKTYLAGIGLYSIEGTNDKGTFHMELVEQIPGFQFNALSRHNIKRVAYIDPAKKIDQKEGFKPCDSPDQIFDYYNGDPDGSFIGGKKALWEAIRPQLDTSQLSNESGYLTFRFVINCKGATGWFITEQTDLDFNPKEFTPNTVNHLLNITASLSEWRPTHVWGENRDSYAYLTYKMNDGHIIELLP